MAGQEDVQVNFSAIDKVSPALKTIGGQAQRVARAFDGMTRWAANLGGLAGAFGLYQTVGALNQTYKSVGRVRAMTGLAAEQAHAMLDAFELAGIEGHTAERVILGIARKSKDAAGSLMQLAESAQQGKVHINDLVKKFGVPRQAAADMMRMLVKGPVEMKRVMADTLKSGDLIDEKALASFEKMQRSKRELADAWQGVAGTLYKSVIPIATKLLQAVQKGIERWQPTAQRWADWLAANMDKVLATVKKIGLALAANKAIMFATGGEGIGGLAVKGVGAMLKAGGKGGGGKAAMTEADALVGAIPRASGVLKFFFGSVGRLSLIGAAVLVGIRAFSLLQGKLSGFMGSIGKTLGSLGQKLAGMWAVIGPAVTKVADFFATVLVMALDTWLKAANAILDIMGKIFGWVGRIIDKIPSIGSVIGTNMSAETIRKKLEATPEGRAYLAKHWKATGTAYEGGPGDPEVRQAEAYKRASDRSDALARGREKLRVVSLREKEEAARKAELAALQKPGAPNFDFRNSRFDIKQEFAEGFSPDRIAVAFANDLASLGERRVQSNLSPIFGI